MEKINSPCCGNCTPDAEYCAGCKRHNLKEVVPWNGLNAKQKLSIINKIRTRGNLINNEKIPTKP